MKYLWLTIGLTFLAGCQTYAQPTYFNGRYYMAGDQYCKSMRQYKRDLVMCMDGKGRSSEPRRALSAQDLYMYQTNQMIAAQQNAAYSAQLSAQIDAQNNAMAAHTQNTLNNVRANNVYRGPSQLNYPGGNQVRCVSTGFYTNCRGY